MLEVVAAVSAAVGEERVGLCLSPWATNLGRRFLFVNFPSPCDSLCVIWASKLWISVGGFSRDSAMKQPEEHGELIAFRRYFTSNVRFIFCHLTSSPSFPANYMLN